MAAAAGLVLALAAPVGAEAATSAAGTQSAAASKPKPLLPKAMNGRAAVTALGDKLPEAARLNGRSPAALSKLLGDDPTMWLDQTGRLFVADELHADEHAPALADSAAATGDAAAASFSAVAPLGETFALHSRATSTKKIFLDFDGINLGPSVWGWTEKRYGGFDNDGDPSTFSTDERQVIQQVWAQVSEDYAPFDVDVTTEDPGAAGLTRSSLADTTYGIRVAIIDDESARPQFAGCETGCSVVGLAYVGVFNQVNSQPENNGPAWVFAYGVANDPKKVAEIASHEVGHTFNLQHSDSAAASGYWAPIMSSSLSGAQYTQWVTDQDQTATIAAYGAPLVVDEPGDDAATARRYTAGGGGVISTPTDLDWYWVMGCQAGATIRVSPAEVYPNMVTSVQLVDGSGAVVASSTGTITIPTDPLAVWTFGVDGIAAGFPEYGSLGYYSIDVVGCDVAAAAPSAPRAVGADTTGTSTRVSWTPPSSSGGVGVAALTYEVSLNDGPWTSVGSATTATLTTTSARQTVAVRAVNAAGSGPAVVVVSAVVPRLTRVWTTSWPGGPYPYRLFWSTPEDSGAPITRNTFYRSATGSLFVFFNGASSGQIGWFLTEGTTYWFTLTNRVGESQRVAFVARLSPVVPGAVGNAAASPDKFTGDVPVSWTKPIDDGTGVTLRYQVALDDGGWVDVASPAYTFTGVVPGAHTAKIRAVNEVGPGPEVSVPFTMEALDTTAPVITPTVSGTLGSNGWYVGDVTVAWDVSDPETGIASQTAGCDTQVLSSDTTSTAYTCGATNGAGLADEGAVSVKRDATKPTLAPTPSASVVVQGGTVSVSPNASDATSSIDASLTGCDPASTAVVGVITVQCTATDNAGNVQTATASYTVVNAFLGFQAPKANAVLSASSTISIRFTVGDLAGTSRSTTADVQVRMSTAPNGGGTVLVTRACTYSATVLAYQCSFKAPSNVSKGRNALPYYLTVFQRVPSATGPWYLMPNGTGVANGNSVRITFK